MEVGGDGDERAEVEDRGCGERGRRSGETEGGVGAREGRGEGLFGGEKRASEDASRHFRRLRKTLT